MLRVYHARKVKMPGPKAKPPQAAPTPSKKKAKQPARGWSDFSRNGGELVRTVGRTGQEVSFSTNKAVPQMRLRSASIHADEVEELSEDARLTVQQFKDDLAQWRCLIMMGEAFVVSSGSAKVIADRHPNCPADIVDAHLKRVRTLAKSSSQRATARDAKAAATASAELLALVKKQQRSVEKREARVAERETRMQAVTAILLDGKLHHLERILTRCLNASVLDQDDSTILRRILLHLTAEQDGFLRSLASEEGAKTLLADHSRLTEKDLDRVELQ